MIPICHVQLAPILSGVQRAMLGMLRYVDHNRFEPHVVCQKPGPLSDELQRWGIPCHFVPSLVRPIHPWHDRQAYQQLVQLFRQQAFQLVHTHSSKPGILGRIAARHAGVPWIVHHVHGFAFHEFTFGPLRWLYSKAERYAGQHCDHVIFCNHEERDMAIQAGILPAEKCRTRYYGIDLGLFTPLERMRCRKAFRQRHQLCDDTLAILFMGRLDKQKQPLILPAIARQLESLHPARDWQIIVAGAGPLDAELKTQIAAGGLANRVRPIGWQSNPVEAFHGCDLYVLPSLWEGLPISGIEALAAGLPSVLSNVKGNREVVTPETGFLCPPHDSLAFATSLAELIGNAPLRERMAAAARERAEVYFDGTINMSRVVALYDECFAPAASLERAA